jgi:hypothetical protein
MAIDELNDRHGKEFREFYERKAKEKAQLQKDNATKEQLATHEERWSQQYNKLLTNTYNEEKARTDAQAQKGAERRKVNDVSAKQRQIQISWKTGGILTTLKPSRRLKC